MTIITERFLAVYQKPVRAGRNCWRFYARVHPDHSPYYELSFRPMQRTFSAHRVEKWGACRPVNDQGVEKLRRMLPDEEIAALTAAAIMGGIR